MDFRETVDYLYGMLPMYQRVGKIAFKKDLSNTYALCRLLGDPHHSFRSVHIAGTNGKGSSAHMLASILSNAGYKTGLYTSPHLFQFTERIRINGLEIPESYVVDFVRKMKSAIEEIQPSFFELTVAMAFKYFADEKVDIAVVEVGLGGRLDSTNVLIPEVSLITNISYDHMDMLGNTLEEIAAEKAGIIKKEVPVVVGEYQSEVAAVFERTARNNHARLFFASQEINCDAISIDESKMTFKVTGTALEGDGRFSTDLTGLYQLKNLPGVFKTLEILVEKGYTLTSDNIRIGLSQVSATTGLKGRWQVIQTSPLIVCDTAHNDAGIAAMISQVRAIKHERLFIIWGMVKDKDVKKMLRALPKEAIYYFCEAGIPRALPAGELAAAAADLGLHGIVASPVDRALALARKSAGKNDLIIISGSNFIVSELSEIKRTWAKVN